jgi:hypothetical protein
MTIFEAMIQWDKDRNNLVFDKQNEVDMLISEAKEFRDAYTEHEEVDGLADTIKVSVGALFKKGYNPEMVLNEMLKHISSRKQDTQQKEVWDKWGASGKWQKQKDQDPSTLYEPNYERCKL